MGKPSRVFDSVLPLNVGGPAAVLKIVDADLTIHRIFDATTIQPNLGELMNKEGPGVNVLYVIEFLPFKGRGPFVITVGAYWKSWGTQG